MHSQYHGRRNSVIDTHKYVEGSVKQLHIVSEVTPNICRWVWIQSCDLKAKLPVSATNFLAKSRLAWANSIQEKYRRNNKEVDEEVRDSIVEQMMCSREKVESSLSQEQVS